MKKAEQIGVIIVAAGLSQRFGKVDKVLALLAGKPVLVHVLEPFIHFPGIDRIILPLNRHNLLPAKKLLAEYGWDRRIITCLGGKRRQDSVYAGFKKLGKCDWVIIQDGARPLVTTDLIERGMKAANETGAAIPAVPAKDTIKLADKDGIARWTLPRESLYNCQTPQVFRYEVLASAFEYIAQDVTDEAQLVELTGGRVKLFPGAYDNIKITAPADLAIAEALLRSRGD
ncbi:MAG: 2-C-methyl-D-erythritol 4-phosphate cytidylyltransferase [Dehalococcoidia bacterium]|nr:2-C-methyl-D-erythritol 4-phosphate cytidylyltransferase [Dehalococcoidia bacterium]